jgi:hypothetical protein
MGEQLSMLDTMFLELELLAKGVERSFSELQPSKAKRRSRRSPARPDKARRGRGMT